MQHNYYILTSAEGNVFPTKGVSYSYCKSGFHTPWTINGLGFNTRAKFITAVTPLKSMDLHHGYICSRVLTEPDDPLISNRGVMK